MKARLYPLSRLCLLALVAHPLTASAQGTVTEAKLAKWLLQFPDADLNADGKLTPEEAMAYRGKLSSNQAQDTVAKVPPTHPDVAYGGDERNRFDLWLPGKKSDALPVPVLIHFHGGGFVAGDKGGFDPSFWLKSGIACVSANYRFVNGTDVFSEAPLLDSARVVQTLRERAGEWGLDRGRIALTGSSAGAVISMWIAYHDDLADPESGDPVSRQSSRVNCLIPFDGPTNLMPDWILKNIGGSPVIHESYPLMFGRSATDGLTPEVLARIRHSSPWEHVSADDPPTLLIYTGPLDAVPLPPGTSTGKVIHHPAFGKALKDKLDGVGVENDFKHGFDPQGTELILGFLRSHFGMND